MAKVENGKKKGRHKGERHIEDTRMWRGMERKTPEEIRVQTKKGGK